MIYDVIIPCAKCNNSPDERREYRIAPNGKRRVMTFFSCGCGKKIVCNSRGRAIRHWNMKAMQTDSKI